MTFESALMPSTFAIALFEVVFLMVIAALVACDAMTCFLAWRQRPQDHQALECELSAVLAECETLKGLSEILSLANTLRINRGLVFNELDASREECRELKEKLREALERERDLQEDLVRMTRFEELGAREILKLKSDFLDLEIHHSAILKLGAATQKAQEEKVEAQSQRETLELLNQVADLKNQLELLSVASPPLVESGSAETQVSPQKFVSSPVAELVPDAVTLLSSTSVTDCILLSEFVSTNALDVVECCTPPAVQVLAIASPSRTATPFHISVIPATAVVIASRSPAPEEAISTPFPVATPLDSVPYPVPSADLVDVSPPSVQVFATPSPAIASIEFILNINSTPFTPAVTTVTSPVDIEVVVPVAVPSPAAAPIEAPMRTPFEDVSALPPAIFGAIEIVGIIVPVDSVTALSESIPARIATTIPKPTVSVKERVRLLEEVTSVLEDSTEELAVAFQRLDLTAGFGQVNEAMDLDLAETVQLLDAAPAAEPALLETYAEQVILAVSQSTVVALDLQDDDLSTAAELGSLPPPTPSPTTAHQSVELTTAVELDSLPLLSPSTTTAHQFAELNTAAELGSLPPPSPPSTTTVHQSAELSTTADLISLSIFRDQGEGDEVDAMFIDMPDTEAPVYCLGNDWAAEMGEAEDHEEAMVAMLTICLQGNGLDLVAPAAEEPLVASDATADTDLFAFCEITSSPVVETCVAEGVEAAVLFGDADVVMQEAATQDKGLMEAAVVEDRPQLAESLKRRQFREPASIAKRHARAARETAVRLEVSVAVEADEDVVMGDPQPAAPRVARKEYSWAARVERLALAARRIPTQGSDAPAAAVVAPAVEANSLDLFASVCCVQAAVLPLTVAEVNTLADIEAQAPVALTLLVEARQILDAIEPEKDMTEEDLDDLFSE
ncbi:hypothetical protein BDR26DRAFT_894672 [Obelidium mucronatum]|nr:hypothetical protein BDR26DRAFT_894672 [Obelidium mucronatum]